MKRIKFAEKIEISCSSEFAFDYTQDYENRLTWDTFLKKAELIDGAKRADVGAKAYCVAKNGLEMVTEYVTFKRPKVTAIKMTNGPFLFKSFSGSWTFNELHPNLTEVLFLYSFEVRFPFTIIARLIKKNLQNNVAQRLKDLKENIEKLSTTR